MQSALLFVPTRKTSNEVEVAARLVARETGTIVEAVWPGTHDGTAGFYVVVTSTSERAVTDAVSRLWQDGFPSHYLLSLR